MGLDAVRSSDVQLTGKSQCGAVEGRMLLLIKGVSTRTSKLAINPTRSTQVLQPCVMSSP